MEYLGSAIPRILRTYTPSVFHFSENFLRITFKYAEGFQQETNVTPEVRRVIQALAGEMARRVIQEKLGLKDADHFREAYLIPSLNAGFIEMTIPEKPNSRLQKYRLTERGNSAKK